LRFGLWLMPNHTPLILVPETVMVLVNWLREIHRRYTRHTDQH
jgi:hypothetical protein